MEIPGDAPIAVGAWLQFLRSHGAVLPGGTYKSVTFKYLLKDNRFWEPGLQITHLLSVITPDSLPQLYLRRAGVYIPGTLTAMF